MDGNSRGFVKVFRLMGVGFGGGMVKFVVVSGGGCGRNSGMYWNSGMLLGV